MFIPPAIRGVKSCERCGLQYDHKLTSCSHCYGLNDKELGDFLFQREEELKSATTLGWIFLAFGAGLVVMFVVGPLNMG